MHQNYPDIRERIAEEPTWFDRNGTPRYGAFHPSNSPNIYANEIALVEIACQDCGRRFLVEIQSESWFDRFELGNAIRRWIKEGQNANHTPVHYGDPPAHGCVGDTMNCEDLRIVEFWHRHGRPGADWKREMKFELCLESTEAHDGDAD